MTRTEAYNQAIELVKTTGCGAWKHVANGALLELAAWLAGEHPTYKPPAELQNIQNVPALRNLS